ncbi:MAG: Hsp70 family protein [bacterium]|nr:Hsp70 family protein [bacterium]
MDTVTIGIDLGTTNTLACYMKKGKPTLVKLDDAKMLRSALYVEPDGSFTIGYDAMVKGTGDPDNLIRSSKTYMGDPLKQYKMRGKSLTPTDVAAEILRQVKATVLKKLKKSEDDTAVKAVITVPAYFSGKQKTETKKAGERAGLEVIRIITEPMAAAVAAGRTKELKGKLLVVDIGGGTFDLSILEADPLNEEYKAIDTAGDRRLGGDDFDQLLYDYFLERLSEKTGMDFSTLAASGLDEKDYGSLRGRLADAVEGTKVALSESTEEEVSIANLFPYKGSQYTFDIVVDREQFDEICQDLYQKISAKLEKFLQKQPFSVEQIDSVILAGGSCYIPRIRAEVERLVHKQADTELSLDTLVVTGACIVAEHESSGIETKGFQDIVSHSMGIEVVNDEGKSVLSKILPKGLPYPCEQTRNYTTAVDNQKEVELNIYEAGSDAEEIPDIRCHDLYGSITLGGIRPAPKGKPVITVTFSYDESQTLKVTAEDQDTHIRQEILIQENKRVALKPKQPPIDFMLLLDTSGSMMGNPLTEAKKACYALIDGMLDFSVHRLGLVSFANSAQLLLSPSQNKQDMCNKIAGLSAQGGTDMVSALDMADRVLSNTMHGKVVIVVSDGDPYSPGDTLKTAQSLRSHGVRVVAIGVGRGVREEFLRQLADKGDAYKLDNMNKLEAAFRTAISAIMEKI